MPCEFGQELRVGKSVYKKCEITGHSGVAPTYYAHCELQPEDRQLEFAKGEAQAHWIDPASRKEISPCKLKMQDVETMVREYEARAEKIEKPQCYLTNWKGQLTLVTLAKRYRCAFKMNDKKVLEFSRDSGHKPAFQCEGGHFLVTVSADSTVAYEKSGAHWIKLCQPVKKLGEPEDPVDWKNPPAFYDPEQDSAGPKAGSGVQF